MLVDNMSRVKEGEKEMEPSIERELAEEHEGIAAWSRGF